MGLISALRHRAWALFCGCFYGASRARGWQPRIEAAEVKGSDDIVNSTVFVDWTSSDNRTRTERTDGRDRLTVAHMDYSYRPFLIQAPGADLQSEPTLTDPVVRRGNRTRGATLNGTRPLSTHGLTVLRGERSEALTGSWWRWAGMSG